MSDEGDKCATNSHIMYYESHNRVGETVLSRQFCEFATILKVNDVIGISCSDKYSVIDTDVFCFGSKLVPTKYPNFPSVIPKNHDRDASFDKNDKAIIKKLKGFLYRTILFDTIHKIKDDNETVRLDAVFSDNPAPIAFNIKYLDMILGLTKRVSKVKYKNSKLLILIDDKFLLMPMIAENFDNVVGDLKL